MEIRPVGLPSIFGGSKSDAAPASTTAGTSSDSISSAKPKESWGSCASRWLCFGPNLVWTIFKKIINIVTCNNFCVDKPSQAEVKKELEAVLTVFKDNNAVGKDKDAAVAGMSPRVREELVDRCVAQKRAAQLGPKATDEKIAEWNRDHAQKVREGTEERLESKDTSLFDSLLAGASEAE